MCTTQGYRGAPSHPQARYTAAPQEVLAPLQAGLPRLWVQVALVLLQ